MGKAERKGKQPETSHITPLLAPLMALQRLLEHFEDKGVIIGGIAASLLGKPRFTADLDAVILLNIEDLPRLIDAAILQGIEPRIPDAEAFARKNRVLLMRHRDSATNIDISLGILPFEIEMVARSQSLKIGDIQLRLPTPEDLIVLKAVAHRTQDLVDIQAIAISHQNLDINRVKYWVEQFGDALDMPDLWEKISQLL